MRRSILSTLGLFHLEPPVFKEKSIKNNFAHTDLLNVNILNEKTAFKRRKFLWLNDAAFHSIYHLKGAGQCLYLISPISLLLFLFQEMM